METKLPRIFIRANLKFIMEGKQYTFPGVQISPFGTSGIKWSEFDPFERVGHPLVVEVEVQASTKYTLVTNATLTAEQTKDASYLGLKFLFREADRKKLAHSIEQEGSLPTQFLRKYPRIPAVDALSEMPLRAVLKRGMEEVISFDISNISPNGILLSTENQKASFFLLGSRVEGQVEPRGNNLQSFNFSGLVCRIVQEKNNVSKNIVRNLGVQFTQIPKDEREKFLAVLRSVLNNLRQSQR